MVLDVCLELNQLPSTPSTRLPPLTLTQGLLVGQGEA